jgi:hypothetical protein
MKNRLKHGKFVLFNLTGGHGGPPYGNTHRRVGHRADRQCVNRPMVNGLCGQNKFTVMGYKSSVNPNKKSVEKFTSN